MNPIRFGLFLAAILAVSCSGPSPQAPLPSEADTGAAGAPASGEPAEQAGQAGEGSMQMTGINLYMHRKVPFDGAPGRPELWVKADVFSIEDSQTYSFEGAHAVIYTRDAEEITLEAQRGRFEQDKSAILEGEVRLAAGALKMLLSDIYWQRGDEASAGMARTDNPVIIDDPELQLNAAGLRLYPDDRHFELVNVSGVIRFGKELQ